MMIKRILTTILIALLALQALCQNTDSVFDYKFSVSTTWLSLANFGEDKTNTQHYELHFKYNFTKKDRIGLKIATWRLFQPMGILWWDGLMAKIDSQSEFYSGRLKECGLGITYQRMLWKGLFATVEILPQLKTYLDVDNNKIANGFKLYTSYHLGYQIPLFKGRLYLEPQIHFQYWPIDSNTPQIFKVIDDRWNNYFLLEPNLYIGVNF